MNSAVANTQAFSNTNSIPHSSPIVNISPVEIKTSTADDNNKRIKTPINVTPVVVKTPLNDTQLLETPTRLKEILESISPTILNGSNSYFEFPPMTIDLSTNEIIGRRIFNELLSPLSPLPPTKIDIGQQLIIIRQEQHKKFSTLKSAENLNQHTYKNNDESSKLFSDISSDISVISTVKTEVKQIHQKKLQKIKETIKRLTTKKDQISPRLRVDNKIKLWPKNTTLITGDSIIQGLDEQRLRKYNVKVRAFPGSSIDDMYDYLGPLLKKKPSSIILHIGTNDATNKTAGKIINEMKNLQIHIEESLPGTKIFISSPSLRTDNNHANRILDEVIYYLKTLFNVILNENIDKECLGSKGLHLNPKGAGRLAINFISLMKRL